MDDNSKNKKLKYDNEDTTSESVAADDNQEIDTENSKPYTIQQVSIKTVKKYAVEEVTFKAKFNKEYHGQRLLDIPDNLHNMFGDIMDQVGNNYDADDNARLIINHEGLERPVFIHCQPKHNITPKKIMDR
jgi:hypothetical protein